MSNGKVKRKPNTIAYTVFVNTEPVFKESAKGSRYCTFKTGSSDSKGEEPYIQKTAIYLLVKCFGDKVDLLEGLDVKVGDIIRVEGYFAPVVWEKDDGTKMTTNEVVPWDIEMIRRKDTEYQKPAGSVPDSKPMSMSDDDIPF